MGRCFNKTKDLRPGQPAKPLGLTERAESEWDRLIAELEESDIQLTPAHRSILSQASQLAADMHDARVRIAKDGAYIEGKAGLVAHPAAKRLDALRRDYIKVLTMLGLKAAAATKAEDKEPSLAEQLGGRR